MTFYRINLRLLILTSVLFLLPVMSPSLLAQDTNPNMCLRIIAESLLETGVNCAATDNTSACFASGILNSVREIGVDETTFDEPGDMIGLNDLITLKPDTVNLVSETWGITVLKMQANLPTNFDRQVVVIGLGGAEMENGVKPEHRFTPPGATVNVTTTAISELRAVTLDDPEISEVIGQIPAGATFAADALSEDGLWARVIFDDRPAWISLAAIDGDVTDLPVYGRDHMAQFQNIYLRSGVLPTPCVGAPSLVLVQSPGDIPVDIIVNCVPIRIESTIILRTEQSRAPLDTSMEITTLFGMATINPDSETPIFVPPGFSVPIAFGGDEFVSLGVEGDADEWSCGELTFGQPGLITQPNLDLLEVVNRLPANLLNYTVTPPRLVIPSGVGQVLRRLIFSDPEALAIAQQRCNAGTLPDDICDTLGL